MLELIMLLFVYSIPYPTIILSHRECLVSGFIASGTAVLQNFGEEKKIKGIGSVTAPAVDFPFPLTSLLYKGASAIYSSGQKGVYVLSGTGASIGLVDTGVYVLNQDIKDNSTTTVAFIQYNVKGLWK